MSSAIGKLIKISVFGESHGTAIGVTIDGLPAGEKIDLDEIYQQLLRRAPGRDATSTPRKEDDLPEVLSGLLDGFTTGMPLTAIIRNTNTRSGDYDYLKDTPRPSHADYNACIKYGGHFDLRGSGHFSGRLTAPIVFAGAVCRQILSRRGIEVGGHIAAIGAVEDIPFDKVNIDSATLKWLNRRSFSVLDGDAEQKMREAIDAARTNADSIGGEVEIAAVGLPVGVGEPMFRGVESVLSSLVFGIPAVKGVSFGAGFELAKMQGSQANDRYTADGEKVVTLSNNNGGIIGGITNGMPLIMRAAIKPTPSIGAEQLTLNLKTGRMEPLTVKGRHDPCIVSRALPAIEAAVCIGLCDLMKEGGLL